MQLIIDSNYVCYVSKFAFSQGLTFRGNETSIVYGFLKQLLTLAEQFKDNNFVFCWDSRESLRRKIYPEYKANRKDNLTEEQKEENQIAYTQFEEIKTKVLPCLGFNNNFFQDGYESDDIIAAILQDFPGDVPVVVSSDKDLYQLLDRCSIYNITKKELYTKELFVREFGIRPSRWATVKAIAGCVTDNVKGAEKVGEKTAIKYLKGELKSTLKTYDSIVNFDSSTNKTLVTLPFQGTIKPSLKINSFSKEKFIYVFQEYGFQSFITNFNKWEKYFL